MAWLHSVIPQDQPMETSKLGDFFKKGIAAHLVREISQNTMDNRVGEGPAHLRFQFATPADPRALYPYLDGLKQHVEACTIDGSEVDWKAPEFLLVEDFGTRGLEGVIDDKNADGSFAKFWYRTGDSNKKQGSSKGGRHGVGKVVNAEASKVRAFFGYSVAGNEGQRTLLGRSYLKPHKLQNDGPDYHGLGTFHIGGVGEPIKPLVSAEADAFAGVVGFAREPHVPGLSIASLWPKEDVNVANIRAAVLNECLYQLTAGQLTVSINGHTIDAANVPTELVAEQNPAALLKMHGLINAVCEASPQSYKRPLAVIEPAKGARLNKDSFDPKVLQEMRSDWLAKLPVLIEAQVLLHPKDKPPVKASFKLALAHAEQNESGAVSVRDDVTVRGAVAWGKKPAVALLIAQKNELSGFLGDAEGPSHEDWDAEYVKDRYSYAAQTIRAVKMALNGIYDALSSGDADVPIENALIEFFSWTPPEEAKKKKKAPPKKKPVDIPEIPNRPALFSVRKTKDGFTVSATDDASDAGVFDLAIRCAYLVRFGNAFKEYSEYDFELEKGLVDAEGATNFDIKGNTILAKGAGSKLHVHVHGLDPNRDLDVRVRATSSAEADVSEAEAA
jgi:hypothetical protein